MSDRFVERLSEESRHFAKLDYDRAEEAGTDDAKLAWLKKWGRRVADHLWDHAR